MQALHGNNTKFFIEIQKKLKSGVMLLWGWKCQSYVDNHFLLYNAINSN